MNSNICMEYIQLLMLDMICLRVAVELGGDPGVGIGDTNRS